MEGAWVGTEVGWFQAKLVVSPIKAASLCHRVLRERPSGTEMMIWFNGLAVEAQDEYRAPADTYTPVGSQ